MGGHRSEGRVKPDVGRVEAALRAFWRGDPGPMDRLIAGPDGGPPYVAAMLMEFVRACSAGAPICAGGVKREGL
jgi:hypothetical protein